MRTYIALILTLLVLSGCAGDSLHYQSADGVTMFRRTYYESDSTTVERVSTSSGHSWIETTYNYDN